MFGLAPFAAVFYPVAILPGWLQPVSLAIPATHVFEGMRAALTEGRIAWDHLAWAVALDGVWLALAAWIFLAQFHQARVRGALLNIGSEGRTRRRSTVRRPHCSASTSRSSAKPTSA